MSQFNLSNNDKYLSVRVKQSDKMYSSQFSILSFILTMLLSLSLSFVILTMFEIEQVTIIPYIFIVLLNVLLHLKLKSYKIRVLTFIVLLSLLFLLLFVYYTYIINGAMIFYNDIVHMIGMNTGNYIEPYMITIDEEKQRIAINFFLVYFLFIILLLSFLIVQIRTITFLVFFVGPLFIMQLYSKTYGTLLSEMFLLFTILVIIVSFYYLNSKVEHRLLINKGKVLTSLFSVVAIVMTLLFLLITSINPVETYKKQQLFVDANKVIKESIDTVRFEKNKPHTFTDGDFTKLSHLKLVDEPALEVVMSMPTSLYLRGFVGSTYTSKRWETLTPEVYYENKGLFYWLEENDFSPLTQLSTIHGLTNGKDDLLNEVMINNVHENSKYMYTPYELHSIHNLTNISELHLESNVISTKFLGERFYKYKTDINLTTKYPSLANELYKRKDDANLKSYFKNESYYNEFVYEHYTDLPSDIETMIGRHFGNVKEIDEIQHVPYEWAIEKVKSYLEENIQYSREVETFDNDIDFLIQLIENKRKGFATHFATAGTMMFRYLGIPARYVEGYIVTPETVKNKAPLEKMTITGTLAHAWTEIYIDNVGWIPIEVTPTYKNVMEPLDLTNYPGGEQIYEDDQLLETPTGDLSDARQEIYAEDEQSETNNESNNSFNYLQMTLYGLLLLILILLIVYIAYVIIKRNRLKALTKEFFNDNYKSAMPKIFSYCLHLLQYDGLQMSGGSLYNLSDTIELMYTAKLRKKFDKAILLNQLAIYGQEDITEQQMTEMIEFYKNVLVQVVESKSVITRLKMKYIHFVY